MITKLVIIEYWEDLRMSTQVVIKFFLLKTSHSTINISSEQICIGTGKKTNLKRFDY